MQSKLFSYGHIKNNVFCRIATLSVKVSTAQKALGSSHLSSGDASKGPVTGSDKSDDGIDMQNRNTDH